MRLPKKRDDQVEKKGTPEMRLNQGNGKSALQYGGVLLIVVFTGCASLSNRQKSLITMVGAGLAGAAVGYVTAPQDTLPLGHAALFGGGAAAVAGVASLFIFDEQKRSSEFERELNVAKTEISVLRGEGVNSGAELLYESSTPLGKSLPGEYTRLVQPGKWSVYKLNQWIPQGENTLIHQDRMVKIIPPSLNPKSPQAPEKGKAQSAKKKGSKARLALPIEMPPENNKAENQAENQEGAREELVEGDSEGKELPSTSEIQTRDDSETKKLVTETLEALQRSGQAIGFDGNSDPQNPIGEVIPFKKKQPKRPIKEPKERKS